MYPLIKPLLFKLDAEKSHHLAFKFAHQALRMGLLPNFSEPAQAHQCMGLTFPNRVGLAAGLDKNGEHIDVLARLGFGFIEIGTITPRPQLGNPKPRLFRLPEAQAIINRMGFNNQGVDALISNVKQAKFTQNGGILGINIGKNADTPMENAVSDYLICLSKVYAHASYVTVNISSPNTKNLRDLQSQDALDDLLKQLKQSQLQLADTHQKYVPMTLKIAPDVDDEQLNIIAELLKSHRIDGVIATNTTLDKTAVTHLKHGNETGGLSGMPVRNAATQVIQKLSTALAGALPIIGVGGIGNADDALEKINAGANLIQVYSGLIYQGPALVSECVRAFKRV
ncbi:MAG: quinone-dependent dihydroorotate dehydrogenase [Formosimonas sp.]